MQELKCFRCGHKWIPRIKKPPVACPNCNSRKWSVKK